MKKTFIYLSLVIAFVTITNVTSAQSPPSGGGQPQGNPPATVPIDGGVGALLVGIVGYAYKKLNNNKEKR